MTESIFVRGLGCPSCCVHERTFPDAEPATIWAPAFQQVPAEPNSRRFVSSVSDFIGVESPIPNPSPDGGGLHQTTTVGFLIVRFLAFEDRFFQRRRGGP